MPEFQLKKKVGVLQQASMTDNEEKKNQPKSL